MGHGDFSLAELRRRFGEATVDRGRVYAAQGRVIKIVPKPAEGVLFAEVHGSGTQVYTTVVTTGPGQGDVSGRCSCPVRTDCKHVVAVLLARQNGEHRPASRAGSDAWRRSLSALIDTAPPADSAAKPLALQVVRTEARRLGGRIAVRPRLKVRPLVQGTRGGWIKSGATWRDMDLRHDAGQVPAHRSLMREIQATARGAHAQQGYYNAHDELDLDSTSAELWRLLDRAAVLGVPLLDADGEPVIEVDESAARFVVDIRSGEDGGLAVAAYALLEDESIAVQSTGVELLGTPAHGLFLTPDDGSSAIRLVRLAEPLNGAITAFAREPRITVPPEQAAEFFAEFYPGLARSVALVSLDASVDLPEILPPRLTLTVAFGSHDTARLRWRFAYRHGETTSYAELDAGGPAPPWRDRGAESAALDAFKEPDHLLDGFGPVPSALLRGYDVVVLAEQVLPWLADHGEVDVIVEGEQPEFRAAEQAPLVSLQIRDAERDRDWFDLGVDITVDGEQIPFSDLFVALAGEQSHLVLPSGLYLAIDRPEFTQLRDLIAEARALGGGGGDTVQVSRYQSALWEELASLGVVDVQSQRWRDTVETLLNLDALPDPEPPAGLHADLRPYQREGYAWLSFLYDHGLGGILADDMGLGKTVQALALIARAREADPRARFCVVAPTSVVENWAREAARFTPDVPVAAIWQTQARRKVSLAAAVGDAGLVVTSYALFRLEFEQYEALGFDGLLLDEAQFVKNRQAKTHQCVRRLSAPFKLAMTGTPLENSLMDLWSLLSIVAPGLYPRPQLFADWFAKPIERGESPERLGVLRRRITPLMRRRTKAEVLAELPPKQEQVVQIPLGARHERIYRQHLQRERQKVLGLLDDAEGNRFAILRSLTVLRQLSLDPALIDEQYEDVGSAKADALIEQLTELVAEGHRALVFSQFTGYLARIRTRLEAAGIEYAYLDGRTRQRQEAIETFRSGAAPVFLISLKAGGFGLNLTEADYCFVLDPWWNPAAEQQAVDRAHRIGQQNTVMVYRYVSADTIEDKVMAMQARKRDLFDDVMGAEGSLSGALDLGDLQGLFEE